MKGFHKVLENVSQEYLMVYWCLKWGRCFNSALGSCCDNCIQYVLL